MSGQWVSTSPQLLNIWNSGTMVTSLGIQQPGQHEQEHRVGTGNLIRANAYPANEATASVPTVTAAAMYMLLKYCWANGCRVNASR